MFSVSVLAAAGFCGGLSLFAQAQEPPPGEAAVERLLSEDFAAIQEAERALVAARAALTRELIAVIRNHVSDPARQASVEAAMRILGRMRAAEAAEVLVSYIGFPQVAPYDPRAAGPEVAGGRRHWPAAQALVEIGQPCVAHTMAKLHETGHITEQRACLAVLVKLGQADAVKAMLTEAMNEERNPGRRATLQTGLKLLPEITEGIAGPWLEPPAWLRPERPGPGPATPKPR